MNCANTIQHGAVLAGSPSVNRPSRAVPSAQPEGDPGLQVLTLVLWVGFLAVGALGFQLSYSRPQAPLPEPAPLQAQFLNVELTQEELPDIAPAAATSVPLPAAAASILQPVMEPALQVAESSAAIAFAVPVSAPARVVPTHQASWSADAKPDARPVPPPVQTLTFGRGEGRQPAPEYPAVARRQGQQGPVTVSFVVGADGRVISTELAEPNRWPVLNEAAMRDIARKWRFSPGPVRAYKVVIRYELEG